MKVSDCGATLNFAALVTFKVTAVVSELTEFAMNVTVPVTLAPAANLLGSAVIVSVAVDMWGMVVPGMAVMVPELGEILNHGLTPGGSLVVTTVVKFGAPVSEAE